MFECVFFFFQIITIFSFGLSLSLFFPLLFCIACMLIYLFNNFIALALFALQFQRLYSIELHAKLALPTIRAIHLLIIHMEYFRRYLTYNYFSSSSFHFSRLFAHHSTQVNGEEAKTLNHTRVVHLIKGKKNKTNHSILF